MWLELLEIFRGDDPMKGMGDEFMKMLKITHEMADIVRPHVFDHLLPLPRRKDILELDVEVNKLERSIRRQIVSHLSLKRTQVPYCLLLLMLVKDAERLGDFVKNISEVEQYGGSEVPQGPLREELEDLINLAMELFEWTPKVIADQDRDRAEELCRKAENSRKRSDKLLQEISKSDLNTAQTTALVLLTRFYRRITGHLGNILSSVVLPIHQVDYFGDSTLGEEE